MALEDDVKQALKAAGEQLKKDLWHPDDDKFLTARARDLVGLQRKAQATTDPNKKKAYEGAALDTVQAVKMLALIRMEAGAAHIVDALGRFFMDKVVPLLVKLLPTIIAAL
jgi:hypothetical protein